MDVSYSSNLTHAGIKTSLDNGTNDVTLEQINLLGTSVTEASLLTLLKRQKNLQVLESPLLGRVLKSFGSHFLEAPLTLKRLSLSEAQKERYRSLHMV